MIFLKLITLTLNGITDWEVKFSKKVITLYNIKTKWHRLIDLDKMTATMKFPTGEEYIYNCNFIGKNKKY